jgi:chromosome segregation ATPase
MSDAFEVIKAELDESKERWKEVQTRLVAEVERTNEENGRLKQAIASQNAEMGKLKSERDAAVRRQQQVREEIGPLKLELQVAFADLKTARSNSNAQQWEINRLTAKLGKKTLLAQANLKKVVEKFREQTNAAIQVLTAMALQTWSEQAAQLQVLRADKANRDLRGPGSWKLDKANCEAVQ